VPAHNEEEWIGITLLSLQTAKAFCQEEVEIIVYENGERDRTREIVESYGCAYYWTAYKSRTLAKNKGAIVARGNILVFVDADCIVSEDFFQEISEKAEDPYAIGGGMDNIKLPRYSLGIHCFLLVVGMIILWHQIRVGAFWVRKRIFESLGGFRNRILDDVDFAKRLNKYKGYHTSSLETSWLLWSTRKFDKYGDWYWLKGYR